MKKLILLSIISILFIEISYAQNIGIGTTTPNASSILEIKSGNKGVLIPRTSAASRTAIVNPAKGLMVYDTTTSSFWFHNGSAWVQIEASGTAWSLTGNSGTNPATDFLGTTDAQPLMLRLNNHYAGKLDSASGNYLIGVDAGKSTTTALETIAIGTGSLAKNTDKSYNIAIGDSALSNNYTANPLYPYASYNIAIGSKTLLSNRSGYQNIALGTDALLTNDSGYYNIAIGTNALQFNIEATHNIAVGVGSLYSHRKGDGNIAFGTFSLYADTSGSFNTGFGGGTLQNNVNGSNNTAAGSAALFSNTTGNSNVGIGRRALYLNTTRSNLVAIGDSALFNNGTGAVNATDATFNTAVGSGALYSNTTGYDNTANGLNALYSNTTGFSNTANGYAADVSSGNLTNATVIGSNAIVDASNKVRIGNGSVTVIEGQVPFTSPSDGRFKTNITETVKGLEFITKLRPVVYNFQAKRYDEFLKKDMPNKARYASQDFSEVESIRQSGFVAQEVEKAAKEAGYDFNGIIAPKNDKQTYSLAYSQFVVPLVKAVQEQQQTIEEQNKKIDLQQQQINALLKEIQLIKEKLK